MKRFLLVAICLFIIRSANAQKNLLSLNEQNKYIYYQVVDMPGISLDSLKKNAEYFIKTVYPKSKARLDVAGGDFYTSDKFLVYSVITYVKHESGEIAYMLNIECKDSKYRYWLTDFVFTPYEKDRYGVFVPKPGIDLPLETALSRVDKKELNGYFDQTGAFCKQLGEKLKLYMVEGHAIKKVEKQPAKVVTDKW
jgi:hypothetical protein